MRKESEGVTENLLASARKEFLEYGFHDASLRRISADSGVSTNSIYTRFGDKSGLFTAIVKEAADELMAIYSDSIKKAGEATDISRAEDAGDEGTDLVLEYIYRHPEEFKLIFCCSAGTEYETYFDRLAAKEEYYYKQFAKQFSDGGHPIDDFFIHVYCRNGWQYVYELITHDKSYEEAKEFMANVRAFTYAGWQAVIGMKF